MPTIPTNSEPIQVSANADRVAATRLFGRESEIAQLRAWLDDVIVGRSQPLVLDGEPGIGKTSLLRVAREEAARRGALVISITSTPSGASLAFAGLQALTAPMFDAAEASGVVSEAAQLRIVLQDASTTANPVTVCGGLVALLATTAEVQPIVLVVDDGQWLDRSSAEIIVTALRGLPLDRVGLLVATRSGEPGPFSALQRLQIVGLARSDADALFAGLEIAEVVMTKCWDATGGNPLALDVVLRELDARQRTGIRPLPDPLPVAGSIAAAFQHRLEALPTSTFTALLVLAADAVMSPLVLTDALSRCGVDMTGFDAAEEAGVVVRSAGRIEFAHPLLRARALAIAKPSELRAAHRALAEAHGVAGETEPQAWQLAAAATGPDSVAADALAAVAVDARRRGATAVAAAGFLRSARLSANRTDRAVRLVAAGDATWVVGRADEATALLDEALEASQTPAECAAVKMLLGKIELWERGPRVARDRFISAIGPLEQDHPDLAAQLLGHAAAAAIVSGDVRGSLVLARRAHALVTDKDPATGLQTTIVLGYLEIHDGEANGLARLEPIIKLAEQFTESDDPDVIGLLGLIGMCLTETERLVDAERFLTAVVRQSRRDEMSASGALVAAILAEKYWRTGDWLEAAHLTSNDVTHGATMPVNAAWADAFLAHIDAGAGRADACQQRCANAVRGAQATGSDVVLIWAGHAMGLLELGRREWAAAAAQLDRVAALTETLGRRLPGAVWWQGDHIEALTRCGRRDDAVRALRRLDEERAANPQLWPACVAARGRALLTADLNDAIRELTESIRLASEIPAPFEAARSRLLRGERLRAAGDNGATADLMLALTAFERLGATAFAAQARDAIGATAPPQASTNLADALTGAELRVALLVARGATNREVAADLFVSIKTVEYHLQNIYRKLTLRSRTELAVRVAREMPD